MTRPGSLAWFAAHEIRLVWRDFVGMATAGRKTRAPVAAVLAIALLLFLHWIAHAVVAIGGDDPRLAVTLTGAGLLVFALMLSQALESVTRAFYARQDLDLILASPAPAETIFAVRVGAVALGSGSMAALLAGPFIDALAYERGSGWLAGYAVVFSAGAAAAGFAVMAATLMFRLIGPRRTRVAAQVVAAVVGAAFVIGVQIASILFYGQISRLAFFQSDAFAAALPGPDSPLWWPARAASGEVLPLLVVVLSALAILLGAIRMQAGRFAELCGATAGLEAEGGRSRDRAFRGASSPRAALRRKELVLILRDPWLLSQSLMQLLYLIPPAILLWRNYGGGGGALVVLVPVLVMAAGQLGGGLAWLAISGEDAPDLIASAPLPQGAVLRAKAEAVGTGVALAIGPFVVAMAFVAFEAAAVTLAGVALAVMSATAIQLAFRTQARRSQFRRRQTASRFATFAEAFSSIAWAAAAALAASGSWFALAPALLAVVVLATAWLMAPAG